MAHLYTQFKGMMNFPLLTHTLLICSQTYGSLVHTSQRDDELPSVNTYFTDLFTDLWLTWTHNSKGRWTSLCQHTLYWSVHRHMAHLNTQFKGTMNFPLSTHTLLICSQTYGSLVHTSQRDDELPSVNTQFTDLLTDLWLTCTHNSKGWWTSLC